MYLGLYGGLGMRKRSLRERRRLSYEGLVPRSGDSGYTIQHHPRVHNKPLRCKSGKHLWGKVLIEKVPFLVCKKCGVFILKTLYEKTMAKKDKERIEAMLDKNVTPKQRLINKIAYAQYMNKKYRARVLP